MRACCQEGEGDCEDMVPSLLLLLERARAKVHCCFCIIVRERVRALIFSNDNVGPPLCQPPIRPIGGQPAGRQVAGPHQSISHLVLQLFFSLFPAFSFV